MSINYGLEPKFDVKEDPVYSNIKIIVKKALGKGKIAGIHNGSTKYAKEMIEMGFKFITVSSDFRSMTKYAQDIINEMNIGDVSRPLIQANSITFFKLLNKKSVEIDVTNLDKIRETIINNNKNDMLNLYSNSHLSKIKNNAYINFK